MTAGGGGSFVAKGVSALLAFGTAVVLARLLGASNYGIYAFVTAWISLLTIPAVFGSDTLLIRESGRLATRRQSSKVRSLLRIADRGSLLLSGVLVLLSLSWLWIAGMGREWLVFLLLGLLSLPLIAWTHLREAVLQGLGAAISSRLPTMIALPALLLGFVLIWNVASSRLEPAVAIGLRTVAAAGALAIAVHLLAKRAPKAAASIETPSFGGGRIWMRLALPLFLISFATIIGQKTPILVLALFTDTAASGVYDAASRGAMLVNFALLSMNVVLAPMVTSLHAQGDRLQLQRTLVLSARLAALVALPFVVGLVALAPWYFSMFGEGFDAGIPVLRILVIAQWLAVATGPVVLLLNMTGLERSALWGVGIGSIFTIALCFVLIPRFGLLGAGAAAASGILAENIILLANVRRHLRIDPSILGLKVSDRHTDAKRSAEDAD